MTSKFYFKPGEIKSIQLPEGAVFDTTVREFVAQLKAKRTTVDGEERWELTEVKWEQVK